MAAPPRAPRAHPHAPLLQYCGNAEVPYTAIKCGACCSELPPLKAEQLEALEAELDDGGRW